MPISDVIEGRVNGVLVSGLIKQTVNNVMISGVASGIVNNILVSGMASGTVNNAVINGLISGIVNNVNVMGEVSSIENEIPISGLIYGTVSNFTFSDYISGIVYGQIKVKPSDLIDDGFISGSIIDNFKTALYNSVSASIGTNEVSFFGSTINQIKQMISGAIEDVVDYNSINDIIVPIYLSKSSITDLTDKILFDTIIANGNYISGEISLKALLP
jgi:hypothetical protein